MHKVWESKLFQKQFTRVLSYLILISWIVSCSNHSTFNPSTKTRVVNNSAGAKEAEANPNVPSSEIPSVQESVPKNMDAEDGVGTEDNGGVIRQKFTLSLGADAKGKVVSTPTGIDCPSKCSEKFDAKTKISLIAQASSGNVFKGWGDGVCKSAGSTPVCEFELNADVTVTPQFDAVPPTPPPSNPSSTILVSKSGLGQVQSDPVGISCGSQCNYSFLQSQTLQLTASADPGYRFDRWELDCVGTGVICSISMANNRQVRAVFSQIPKQTCTVDKIYNAYVQCGFPTSAQGLKSGSSVLKLPNDASDISLRITEMSVDDYFPSLYIRNQLVYTLTEFFQPTHWIRGLNIDISGRLQPGDNPVSASVYDSHGTCVQVAPRIVGSYKAISCDSSLYP